MDVMRPAIVRIGNICYRKNRIECQGDTRVVDEYERTTTSAEACDIYADESCDTGLNVEETQNGYQLSLSIPSAYFKFIIGKRGDTKKRIEDETNTQIRIPRQGEEGCIVIYGQDRYSVVSANTRINLLIESARRRQPFTHFLSFPVQIPSVKTKFEGFKDEVLRVCRKDKGIDETIFQNSNKLHVTLGTIVLLDKSEIDRAKQLLDECKQHLSCIGLLDGQLAAHIKGLEYMNDDPNAVDVLYAKISLLDGSDRLQMLVDCVVSKFVSSGLMSREYDHVKLHITVMNTLFRKEPDGLTAPHPPPGQVLREGTRERECFNATNVLKLYGDYDFGTVNFDSMHISQRNATGNNGYYVSSGHITLP